MRTCFILLSLFFITLSSVGQTTVATNGNKFALLENINSVGVPFSPDADHIISQIEASIPRAICVNFHRNYVSLVDAMEIPASLTFFSTYLTGIPTGTVDRTVTSASSTIDINRLTYTNAINARLATAPTYDITMTHSYNNVTRQIAVSVTGTALASLSGDYHFNVYVVEDSVIGVGPGYDQKNSFYNTQVGHPAYGLGDPILGYAHPHVVRAVLAANLWGDFAVSNPVANTSTTKMFSYTLPPNFDDSHVKLVGMVMKYGSGPTDRAIQNAVDASISHCPDPAGAQLCGVSTNTATGKNVVYWDTTGITGIAAYKVYRESDTPGKYNLLGIHPASLQGLFTDMGALPEDKSYRYRITTLSTCGSEKSLDSSVRHRTIHLASSFPGNGDISLSWNMYEGISYATQDVMRSVNGGAFTSIAQLSAAATTYADLNPPAGSVYRIDIPVTGTCGTPVISSNKTSIPTGISKLNGSGDIALYPNPAGDVFYLDNVSKGDQVALVSVKGSLLKSWVVVTEKQSFGISDLPTGVYVLKVSDADGRIKGKISLRH